MAKKKEETGRIPADRADKFTWDVGDLVFETAPKEEEEEEGEKDLAWGQKPYTIDNPPDRIAKMPKHAQEIWIAAFNNAIRQYEGDEGRANATAYAAVKNKYEQDKDGNWMAKKEIEPAMEFAEKAGVPLLNLWDYGDADLEVLGHTLTGRVQVAEFGLEGGEKALQCYLHFDPGVYVDDGGPVMNVHAPLKNTSEEGLKEALVQMGVFLEETARPFG